MGTNLEEGTDQPESENFTASEPAPVSEQYVSSYLVEAIEEEDVGVSHQLVVFPVGEENYAMPIDDIKEVIGLPEVTPIPQSPAYVLGVANVRGTVHAVLDLGVRLGLDTTEEQSHAFVMVLGHEEIKVALKVSQVPETVMVFEKEIDRSSAVITRSQKEQPYIKGLINKEERLITLVDMAELTQVSESDGSEQNLI